MNLKVGTIWKDRYENFSKVRILKLNEDYYKKVEYEWIYFEQEKTKIGKINYLSEKAFLDIYQQIEVDNNNPQIISVSNENETIVVYNENETIVVSNENEAVLAKTINDESIKHTMKHRTIKTSSNKNIEIFDDVFTSSERQYHLSFIQNSHYSLGKNSNDTLWQKNKTFFQSPFDKNQLDELGIFSLKSFDPINHYLSDQNTIKNSWALASTPFSTYYFHVDTFDPNTNGKTLLYYVNDRWDKDCGGETLFANESGEPEYAVQYKPGRIVIYDSSIEHRPASISMEADEFRFIFVTQFLSKDFNENDVLKHRHN